MSETQTTVNARQHPTQSVTLAEFVHQRTGVPLGHSDSLRNMLHCSLGAGTFARFWQYWNPIWGYGLGKYVYSPLQRFLPRVLALLMTFVISGGLHDLATVVVKGSTEFLFTIWFTLMGAGVIVGRAAGLDFSHHPWATRAAVNLVYIFVCLAAALLLKPIFAVG